MNGLFRKYGRTNEQALLHVKEMTAANAHLYAGVHVRCVMIEDNGHCHNLLCVIQASPSDLLSERKQGRQYQNVHLLEDWFKTKHLPIFFQQFEQNVIEVDGKEGRLGKHSQFLEEEFLPSNNDYSRYPGFLFRTTIGERAAIPHDPLLAYDLPFYGSVFEAAEEWCQVRGFRESNDARIGTVLLFLPECRARLSGFTHVDAKLNVELNLADPKIKGLRLKGAWQAPGGSSDLEAAVTDDHVVFSVPSDAEALELYLIGPDETIYDFHKETQFSSVGQTRALAQPIEPAPSEEIVRTALMTGESETIEFKPFINASDSKQEELIATAIAFANTKGGAIFIGVDDRCVIRGVEREIAKIARRKGQTAEDAMKNYVGWLLQAVVGAFNRTLFLEVKPLTIDNHKILFIKVPEGDHKPYADVRSNKIYIRRGANNSIPDPDKELPLLLQPQAALGDMLFGASRRRSPF